MAFPSYVLTREVSIGGAVSIESGSELVLQATVKSSRSLIWDDTGYRFETTGLTKLGAPGEEIIFELPRTDVEGWRDAASGDFIDVSEPMSFSHDYTLELRVLNAQGVPVKRLDYTVGPFIIPEGVGAIDLDKTLPVSTVAGGQVSIGDGWYARFQELAEETEGYRDEAVDARDEAVLAAENSGNLASASAVSVPASQPAKVTLSGPLNARTASFEIPRGADGANVLPTDAAIAQAIDTPGSETQTQLNATFAPLSMMGALLIRVNDGWTIGLGDSLTSANAFQRSYFEQAAAQSLQQVARLENAGFPGDTVQMMLDRLNTDVIAKRPGRVILMAGTNNAGLNVDEAKAAYREILNRLTAAGIAVACVSIPPRDNPAHHPYIAAWNAWIKTEAESRGLPYVNVHEALSDGVGNYQPQYQRDGLHMSAAGARLAGGIVASALANLWPDSPVHLVTSASETHLILANGLFADANSDGIPDGFAITNAPSRGNVSLLTEVSGIVGNVCRITRTEASGGAFSVSRSATTGFAPGDEIEMAVKFRPAVGHTLTYNFYCTVTDSTTTNTYATPYPLSSWTVDFGGEWAVAYMRFIVPSLAARMQMYFSTASGLGAIDVAQFTLRNRTAAGLT